LGEEIHISKERRRREENILRCVTRREERGKRKEKRGEMRRGMRGER
jgi:hypothetical protein